MMNASTSSRAAARRRDVRAGVVLAALALSAAACDDDIVEDDEPDVARMVLVVGSSTVTVAANGQVTGAPLRIPVGTSTVTAQFLRDDGTPDPNVTTTTFRLAVSNAPPLITYTPTAGTFSGTLSASSGLNGMTVNVSFSLFHVEEGHEDFGPFPVQVRVGQ